MTSIRDEYAPRFGRQVLTLWGGAFASSYAGEAWELPGGGGYMIRADWDAFRVRVVCESPRTDSNWLEVDAALSAAFDVAAERWHAEAARTRAARELARSMARTVGARFLAGAR